MGAGLGTYGWAIRHYQLETVVYNLVHAHSDYLEFAADIGVPASLLLFGGLWILAARVAQRTMSLEDDRQKVLGAGCAGALVALLTHSTADFNLQIPGNAFLFAWIAGTGMALVSGTSQQVPGAGDPNESRIIQ